VFFTVGLNATAIMRARGVDERNRKFEYEYTLTKKEERRLDSRLDKVLKAYRIKVQKAIAEEQGYAEEVYGKDNYKMIRLKAFQYVIFDERYQKILHKNVKIDDIDDF
jgi:hypothetical protein